MPATITYRLETVPYTQLAYGDRVRIPKMCNGNIAGWWWRILTVDRVDFIRDDNKALMLHLTEPLPCGDRFVLIAGRVTVEAGVQRVIDAVTAHPDEDEDGDNPMQDQTAQPMTAERLAAIEAAINTPAGPTPDDMRALLAEAKRARADSDCQYMEADYWRESYRLAKGLSDEEIGAIIAVRDASKAHPRPCRFPHESCTCDD